MTRAHLTSHGAIVDACERRDGRLAPRYGYTRAPPAPETGLSNGDHRLRQC